MLYLEDKVAKIVDIVSKILPTDGQMGVYDDDCDWIYGDYDGKIYEALKKIDPEVHVNHGMSKMVIVSSLIDCVIKIPLTGVYYPEWPLDDDDEPMYDEEPEYNFDAFAYGGGEYEDDYCAVEYNIYENMLEENPEFEFLLAKTEFYKQINGVKYYLQEKCRCDHDYEWSSKTMNSASEKDIEDSRNIIKECRAFRSLPWCVALVEEYGVDVMKKAVDFIFNAHIDDLHGGNFGFTKNGKPIIIDYSGFDS